MECIALRSLTFTYPDRAVPALADVSCSIARGQFVTLCGRSGCGKTTLLRQLKSALSPYGTRTGQVLINGRALEEWDQEAQSRMLGFVMQSPEHQIVTDKVWHELAFGLESLGYNTPEIRARVAETAAFFGIEGWFHKNVAELSGGQKQLLNLAAVMGAGPSVLLLDEPTSQLDPIAAAEFLGALGRLNRELGVTILLSEQRLEEALPLSDRVIVLDGGAVAADGTPYEVGEKLRRLGHEMFFAMPTPMRVWAGVPNDLSCPVTVGEGRVWLDDYSRDNRLDASAIPKCGAQRRGGPPAVRLSQVWFRYEKDGPDVIRGLSAEIFEGEIYAVMGGNGTGKTTALSLLSGLLAPQRGAVELFGRPLAKLPDRVRYHGLLGVLPQNPQVLFVKNTLELDLLEGFDGEELSGAEKRRGVDEVLALCELDALRRFHPYDLSGGEQQRAALAKVLLRGPRILLLDEPSKGLDAQFKERLAGILRRLTASGVTVVMVSHDVEFCARHADRCALFFDGTVVSEGEPREFFSCKNYYTTAANRMARALLPEAILAEDIILACGGRVQTPPAPEEKPAEPRDAAVPPPPPRQEKRKPSGRIWAMALMPLLAIPLTLYLGLTFFQDRAYYFVSLLVLLEAMLPFFLLFESRRPQARELVVVAVLCALAVGGRAAFFMLPQFKPMTALVILAGAELGGETGFLVGALTAFVSNMFFGQGPWTPWQMFALGLIGMLAGVLFSGRLLRRGRPALCLYGALSTLLIYGGIMNPASVLLSQAEPTLPVFLTAYAMGLPFDLIHAGSTALFLWLIAGPMTEKLERIKRKYGLLRA